MGPFPRATHFSLFLTEKYSIASFFYILITSSLLLAYAFSLNDFFEKNGIKIMLS